ncbi:MAG TPA: histidine kinase [Actinophytocola sp.]|uniref:sensor histidine kinase n=1 Tax=Actinophytocola sp. TaxID=1872138 RepID=UPI002DDCCD76|nr:histidine kinase [Actinophytocola sp.]HEV2780408.1 histidine kinase [Actinophytocola sp.]
MATTDPAGSARRTGDDGDDRGEDRGALIAPALARAIVAVVFSGFGLVALLFVQASGKSLGETALATVYLAGLLGLQYFYFGRPGTNLRSPQAYAALAVQVCLGFLPLLQFGVAWVGQPAFVAGTVLLVFPPAVAWLGFAAVLVGGTLARFPFGPQPLDVVYGVLGGIVVGLYVYGLTRLARLITELHDARNELAATAVAHERLRFARDLHDLLGLSLSAIAPKGELALRLLQRNPERAKRELSEILGISRRTLADVRSVARVYREMSLDEETRSLESMLAASNVEFRMQLDHRGLSPQVRTMLAAVLRVGVADVLRHEEVRQCEISLRQQDDLVVLDIIHDGGGSSSPESGARDGFDNLAVLVARAGGTLTVGSGSGWRFRLHVTLPVTAGSPAEDEVAELTESVPRIATKLAGALVVAVLCGFAAQAVVRLVYETTAPGPVAVGLASLIPVLFLQLAYFSRPGVRLRPRASYALLAAQALLVYVPLLYIQVPWTGLPGFLAGSALLALRPALGWTVFVAVVAATAWVQVSLGAFLARDIGFNLVLTVNNALVTFGLTWMARSVRQLRATRRELAEVAVAEERLRFARDVHDLLGLSLSAITLKSELAHRLIMVDQSRARTELAEVLAISRHALADVRSVASGYHELSLEEECRTTESLLAAADLDVRLDVDYGDLPSEVSTVLATVLREGVTNVLRHSKGERCEITIRRHGDTVHLHIVNDGVTEPPDNDNWGNGIRNLSDRLAALGGELSAGFEDGGRFGLRARVPVSRGVAGVVAEEYR